MTFLDGGGQHGRALYLKRIGLRARQCLAWPVAPIVGYLTVGGTVGIVVVVAAAEGKVLGEIPTLGIQGSHNASG